MWMCDHQENLSGPKPATPMCAFTEGKTYCIRIRIKESGVDNIRLDTHRPLQHPTYDGPLNTNAASSAVGKGCSNDKERSSSNSGKGREMPDHLQKQLRSVLSDIDNCIKQEVNDDMCEDRNGIKSYTRKSTSKRKGIVFRSQIPETAVDGIDNDSDRADSLAESKFYRIRDHPIRNYQNGHEYECQYRLPCHHQSSCGSRTSHTTTSPRKRRSYPCHDMHCNSTALRRYHNICQFQTLCQLQLPQCCLHGIGYSQSVYNAWPQTRSYDPSIPVNSVIFYRPSHTAPPQSWKNLKTEDEIYRSHTNRPRTSNWSRHHSKANPLEGNGEPASFKEFAMPDTSDSVVTIKLPIKETALDRLPICGEDSGVGTSTEALNAADMENNASNLAYSSDGSSPDNIHIFDNYTTVSDCSI